MGNHGPFLCPKLEFCIPGLIVLRNRKLVRVHVIGRTEGGLALPVLEGHLYVNEFDEEHDKVLCKIVKRHPPDESMTGRDPTFVIRFADGTELVAIAEQLRPWYTV